MFRLIDIIIDIIFFSINRKKYFDRSILVKSMTVLIYSNTPDLYLIFMYVQVQDNIHKTWIENSIMKKSRCLLKSMIQMIIGMLL